MQLSNYITDLLYRYECVIIPGFGAFLTRVQSARIDESTNTFYPPSKVLSFNKQLQVNDGLLANYVAWAEKCSYEVALQRVRKFAAQLTSELNSGKSVQLTNIGELYLNEQNILQFNPVQKQNFNTAAFGLSSVVSDKISREQIGGTPDTDKRPIVLQRPQKTRIPYIKYASVAAIAVLAVGFGSMKIYENQIQKYNFAQREKATTLVENQIQEATFVLESPLPTIKLQIEKQTGKYHLVAGAYKLEENADKRVEQLREKGYSARKLGTVRYGLHQVLYGSFEDRKEALSKLHAIQASDNPDAWLLVQEIK